MPLFLRLRRPRLSALAALIASLTFAGLGADNAHAALGAPCSGSNIEGHGSVLQGPAQTIWTLFDPATNNSFNTNMTAGCTLPGPTVRYTRTNSGQCLSALGANTGTLTTTTWAYCGTESPPTAAQITTINSATKSKVLTIPVAQLAIAIVVNPPSGCTISTVTTSQLEQTFRGAIATWSGLSSSGTCGSPINRVVPNDPGGTTYPFKHFLGTTNGAVVHNGQTWSDLQSTASSGTWPNMATITKSQSGCAAVMSLPCGGGPNSGATGDDDEVQTVGATAGSIGFGALGSARTVYASTTHTNFKWLTLRQSGGAIDPSTNGLSTVNGMARCTTTSGAYSSLPGTGATGAWDSTYMANPWGEYPLCALTWDLALTQYEPHWGAAGTGIARTARDYLHYVFNPGQAIALFLSNNNLQLMPSQIAQSGTTGTREITG